ncbi:MAG: sodium/proline symporter PutP [Gammaproteobacteria bacterium]|nr:sodium/proline symporter PutP [Gammaproteobacteria bacterium]NVK86671.1 sodium/proline symporter PutP [Gammaproteobacteria bacterium]
MSTATLVTFIIYLVGMLGIGVWAYFRTRNLSDYILGGRKLGGLVTGLSASASDMSGWLLLGVPGAIYAGGLGEMWIAVGLVIGAYFNWRITAPRLRIYTEQANNSITLPEYFTHRFEDRSSIIRVISALVILVFFTVYVASGLTAGAKLFEASFELDYTIALVIGALVIVSYTFIGGFLAVSWTDVVQGLLMAAALIVAPIVMVIELGSLTEVNNGVSALNPTFSSWLAGKSASEFFLSISFFSLMAWGLGYYGQPHLLARFMAAKSVKEVHSGRRIAMSWMVISMLGALLVGYCGIVFFAGSEWQAVLLEDSEKVFILATQVLFNEWIAGFLLAAILAAVMSTVDSQLLVTSSAVTEDFYRVFFRREASDGELVWVGRLAVLVIALIATLIALDKDAKVLSLVSNAWAGFGAAFGPVIVMSLVWKNMTRNGALAGMITGALTVILWIVFKADIGPWAASTYEMIPGVILSTVAIFIASKTQVPSITMLERHQQVQQQLRSAK